MFSECCFILVFWVVLKMEEFVKKMFCVLIRVGGRLRLFVIFRVRCCKWKMSW